MAFNSGQAFKEMTEAAQASAEERWTDLEKPFARVMDAQRDALRELATEWFHQEMSDKVLEERLGALREQFVETLVVDCSAGRAACDKAVQAALNCFWESLMAGL